MAGYTKEQVLLFFFVFNIVDLTVQFLFRGVYIFRSRVVSGDFDLDLIKPLPSFFRPLFGWTDVLDFAILVPLWMFFIYFLTVNGMVTSITNVILFLILLLNSVLVGFAFHLFISAVCVMTTEIDHLTWIYRDLTHMARFPTDIYQRGIQYALTFVIPVIVLVTIPAKALLGILTPQMVLIAFGVSIVFVIFSLKMWNYALSQYTSASS